METAQQRSIELSSVTNPGDALLPEPEARDGKQRENYGNDHGVSDGGAPMNAPACPQVIRDDQQWKAQVNDECAGDAVANRPAVNGGTENGHRAEDHEPLVGSGMTAHQQRPPGEHNEQT